MNIKKENPSKINQANFATATFLAYISWVALARLLTLTFITYFMINPALNFSPRYQDISEVFSSNEVTVMSLAALIFIIMLFLLRPLTSITFNQVVNRTFIEKDFLPGFLQGAALATGLVLLFLLLDTHKNLGYLISFQDAPLELLNILFRIFALLVLAYAEEYLFRQKLITAFSESSKKFSPVATATIVTLFYLCVKMIQFDLSILHLINLALLSFTLSLRSLNGSFARGAGLWAGMLTIFHPILSLPIFGNDFSGVLLVKYQTINSLSPDTLRRLLTGGAGGPLSSLTLQLILLADILRNLRRT